MLIVLIKILLAISLLIIFYQDQKDRMVDWWFFLFSAIGFSILHIDEVGWLQFGINSAFNMGLIAILLIVLMIYLGVILQTFRLQEILGLGDILLLFALALGFATVSFVTLLVFGLFFSLLLHLVFKKKYTQVSLGASQHTISRKRIHQKEISDEITVPLAGYLSLFFLGVLLVHWLGFYDNLYVI